MIVAIVGNQPFALAQFRTLLIRDLVSQGHTVYALSPDWDRDAASRRRVEQAGAIPVDIAMGRSAGGMLGEARSVRSIRRELSRLRPDAVFSYFVKPVVYTAAASLGLGIRRRVAMIEGLGFMGASAATGVRALAMRTLYRLAGSRYDALFVLNDADEAYFREEVGLRPSTVRRVEGMGIDVDAFEAAPPPAGSFMALFAARMLRQKGVWEFVEAAARVHTTHPDARFVMLGDVDDSLDSVSADELAARTAAAGVEWKGHVDTVAEYLAEASVFVLPSFYREGYPRSIMEAMAAGRAVITTDNPGCREAVADGDNGLVIPPRDAAALAEAIAKLAGDPAGTAAMGHRGRALAVARYDHRVINADVIEALTGVKPTLL